MIFNSKKGIPIIAIIILMAVLAIFSLFTKAYIATGLVTLVLAYMVYMWNSTYYTITGDELLYRSGFIKGAIPIADIIEITKNKTMYSGLKPALANGGLIVKYTKYDDIYISPADADGFIDALKNVNQNIVVVG